MTNKEMLDALSRLQSVPITVCKDRYEAEELYWQVAELGWALMEATDIAAVSKREFMDKQAEMFERAWEMVHKGEKVLVEDWPDMLE